MGTGSVEDNRAPSVDDCLASLAKTGLTALGTVLASQVSA
jgi:hypothetical protein